MGFRLNDVKKFKFKFHFGIPPEMERNRVTFEANYENWIKNDNSMRKYPGALESVISSCEARNNAKGDDECSM